MKQHVLEILEFLGNFQVAPRRPKEVCVNIGLALVTELEGLLLRENNL